MLLPKGSVGAEVGTWRGDHAASILRWTRPSRLFLVDPWQHREDEDYDRAAYGGRADGGQAGMDRIYQGVLDRFAGRIRSGRVVVYREPSLQAASKLGQESLDWVYIDGDHTYEAVLADLEAYWPVVRPGGMVGGDDYRNPGWWDDGVTRAVDEFAKARRLDVTVIGTQFLIRRPDQGNGSAPLAS